jgi:tetratricopeptide (TPR) repeat protein
MVVLTEAAAFVISGAGSEDVNGVYKPTGKTLYEAPVYANDSRCFLSREPHKDSKTGATSYGWILGQDRKPLYAAKTDSKLPPDQGWAAFVGTFPLPELEGKSSVTDAVTLAALTLKDQGNALFAAHKYFEAEQKWTRALDIAESMTDTTVLLALFSNRAEARLRTSRWAQALEDAQAALRLRPTHDKALMRAAIAARNLGKYMEALGFMNRCLDAHPKLTEAKDLLTEVERLLTEERKAKPSKQTVKSQWDKKDEAESDMPKAFGVKDQISKTGFKAFTGYGMNRDTTVEMPAIETLPYRGLDLPGDKIQAADALIQNARDIKAAKAKKAKDDKALAAQLKKHYKERWLVCQVTTSMLFPSLPVD